MQGWVDLDALNRRAQSLDPLPASVTRLAGLVTQEDPDLDAIVETISLDQALTGRLLGYANSAQSASRDPIVSVRAAVIRMGLGAVLSFTMAASVRGRMHPSVPEYGLAEGELWRHSVASALVTECMMKAVDAPLPPESFASALLHDVGKLVLRRYVEPDFHSILERTVEEAGVSRMGAECQLLGTHHGQLGAWVGEHWGLPQSIIDGIAYHHVPQRSKTGVAPVVHAANETAKALAAEAPEDPEDEAFALLQRIDPQVREQLGLDEPRMLSVSSSARARLESVTALYGS